MLKKITEQLNKKNLTAWQIRESRKRSFQSFLAQTELECRRTVETTKYRITIHKKRTGDKPVLGISNFTITEANISAFDHWLETALASADMSSNQPFDLPEQPPTLPSVEICDTSLSEKTLAELEDRIKKNLSKEKQIRLSAAEFFIDRVESRLINSKGLDLSQEETQLHTEFILLAKAGEKENEYINRYTRRYLSDFDLEHEVASSAKNARDATQASLPKTGSYPVVFSEEPLDRLFEPLIARTSARLKYNRMLNVEIGLPVVEGTMEEPIDIWSNGTLNKSVGSFKFDSSGTPAGRVRLIKNGKVDSLLADKRYGQYLNLPVTGELGNFEVSAGTKSFSDLLDPAQSNSSVIYHIQAFSAFEPNSITGAFSAEIRTGFEISDKGIRPIKGGSVSGVLQKDLIHSWRSKETVQRERCLVPQGILFKKLDIAGS